MHSMFDVNFIFSYYENLSEKEKDPAILTWSQFYKQAYDMCKELMALQPYEKNTPQYLYHIRNAGSIARGVVGYFKDFPKEWQDVKLHLFVSGTRPYTPTYAQLEMKTYDLIAKFFELFSEEGTYRDPCTRHFPCNRLLKNQ